MSKGRYFLGSISGTSVDGLDLALLDLADGIGFVAATTVPFPSTLTETLLGLGQPGSDDLDRVGETDAALGEFIGGAINEFLYRHGIKPAEVSAIGSHGQTIRHRPAASHPFTWQIGDPNRIAELTGVAVVADFRRRDMAAGGQGAPLVPAFHDALFRSREESRLILNIGGISNITLLDRNPERPLQGFDTGPGNCLMDAWCQRHRQQPFDRDGDWAASGSVLEQLLSQLLADSYLARTPPKSTGREYFNLAWLLDKVPTSSDPADTQRTLLEFTARTVTDAAQRWAQGFDRLIVCGGGRLNRLLMHRLAALVPVPVVASEALGADGDAIEAAAFAWLAARRMDGLPGNATSVTGAGGARILGAVYPA